MSYSPPHANLELTHDRPKLGNRKWLLGSILLYLLCSTYSIYELGKAFSFIHCQLTPGCHAGRATIPLSSLMLTHVTTNLIYYTLFLLSGVLCLMSLIGYRTNHTDSLFPNGGTNRVKTLKSLPVNVTIDVLLVIQLLLLSVSIVTGALWAKQAWGHYWNGVPRELLVVGFWINMVVIIGLRHVSDDLYRPVMVWVIATSILQPITRLFV